MRQRRVSEKAVKALLVLRGLAAVRGDLVE
jgi:hypothetical protein